jgi:hypothetical protein
MLSAFRLEGARGGFRPRDRSIRATAYPSTLKAPRQGVLAAFSAGFGGIFGRKNDEPNRNQAIDGSFRFRYMGHGGRMQKFLSCAKALVATAFLIFVANGRFGVGAQVIVLVVFLTAYRKKAAGMLRAFLEGEPDDRLPPETEAGRSRTAFHEAGHVVVSQVLPCGWKPMRASIVPDRDSNGRVDHDMESRDVMDMESALNQLACHFAGAAAEREFCTPRETAGKAGDLAQATDLAERMVCEWGFSGKLPRRRYDPESNMLTEEIIGTINAEIDRFLEMGEALAEKTVKAHRDAIGRVAALLLQHGTLDRKALQAALGPT